MGLVGVAHIKCDGGEMEEIGRERTKEIMLVAFVRGPAWVMESWRVSERVEEPPVGSFFWFVSASFASVGPTRTTSPWELWTVVMSFWPVSQSRHDISRRRRV